MAWIHMGRVRDRRRAVVNMVIDTGFPTRARNFLAI
jgi:hypothetical protein